MGKPGRLCAACLTRRRFLAAGGAAAAAVLLGSPEAAARPAPRYPRAVVGRLSRLAVDSPAEFSYPRAHPNCRCLLVRLGTPALGGAGPAGDIVAFSLLCPHMGGELRGLYRPEAKALGPCGAHLSVFDLRRGGMVVCGHATESLPQIELELAGDEIWAVGVRGLLYGFNANPGAG